MINNNKNKPFFSIIVVCLNPGRELDRTLETILSQTYKGYEIVVKDGCSTDGSIDRLPDLPALKLIRKQDGGIYDAMNQALAACRGDYCIFMNCGDYFQGPDVLRQLADFIAQDGASTDIYYGDIYNRARGTVIKAAPAISPFVCYRNLPCHQACVYTRSLLAKRNYDTAYRVRADYDHFLWSYFRAGVKPMDTGIVIASYEGGGYSETEKGMKLSAREHREILRKYMGPLRIAFYDSIMLLTLQPLREVLAKSPVTGRFYQRIKALLYRKG